MITNRSQERSKKMLREEFTKLTGFYPSSLLYKAIEKAYMDSDSDKYVFCSAYKDNQDGLAEKIQMEADKARWHMEQVWKDKEADAEKRIKYLKYALEREQEWKDSDTNLSSLHMYEDLRKDRFTKTLSEDEAAALVCDTWGFDRDRVRIQTELPVFQVNRHRELRIKEMVPVAPLYNATDWNYVRFSCGPLTYEMVNGDLQMV